MASTVQAYERAEFSLVEVYDRVRIYVISICPKGHADTLYVKKVKKTFSFCNLIII